ncbi:MAG TPA: hypothetical protein VK634_17115 [Reyranella sp.]|nr:hypothetical protein [Reyranella sp.]HTE82408.1 hypothetical protein [Reyranella sp.]
MQANDYVRHPRFGVGIVVDVQPFVRGKARDAWVLFAAGPKVRRYLTNRVRVHRLRLISPEEALGLPPSGDGE